MRESAWERQVLIICRMTWPTTGKLTFNARTLTSDPYADEFFMLISVLVRVLRSVSETMNTQEPTRGR